MSIEKDQVECLLCVGTQVDKRVWACFEKHYLDNTEMFLFEPQVCLGEDGLPVAEKDLPAAFWHDVEAYADGSLRTIEGKLIFQDGESA